MTPESEKIDPRQEMWQALAQILQPGLKADEKEFVTVTAEEVIRRNKTDLHRKSE